MILFDCMIHPNWQFPCIDNYTSKFYMNFKGNREKLSLYNILCRFTCDYVISISGRWYCC